MAALPHRACLTLEACDRAHEEDYNAARSRRAYLGLSEIGDSCTRKLWYRFHWAYRERFDIASIKRFADGHLTEEVVIDRLQGLSTLNVEPVDPSTGMQWRYTDFNGHLAGHMDGKITGVVEAPKTTHVLEVKCVAEATVRKLARLADANEKAALQAWSMPYFMQAQLYMYYSGLRRHFLVASAPGARSWISVRTNYEPEWAKKATERAEVIVFRERLPDRVSNDPDHWECRGCGFHEVCHKNSLATERNCRTCLHSTCNPLGFWECRYAEGTALTIVQQAAGCAKHAYNPHMLWEFEPAASHADARTGREVVTYRERADPSSIWVDKGPAEDHRA